VRAKKWRPHFAGISWSRKSARTSFLAHGVNIRYWQDVSFRPIGQGTERVAQLRRIPPGNEFSRQSTADSGLVDIVTIDEILK